MDVHTRVSEHIFLSTAVEGAGAGVASERIGLRGGRDGRSTHLLSESVVAGMDGMKGSSSF